ncbi:MAG: hypothetical protein GEU90_15555 [Gemmatimonas sp.]|nr:hypothetical protein [Gemmatimonas sp.]
MAWRMVRERSVPHAVLEDPIPHLPEAPELLDVPWEEVAGLLALVAVGRCPRRAGRPRATLARASTALRAGAAPPTRAPTAAHGERDAALHRAAGDGLALGHPGFGPARIAAELAGRSGAASSCRRTASGGGSGGTA